MGNTINPGDTRVLARDVAIGGKVAFRSGDWVTVELVSPNRERPEYRYVCFSDALQQRFQLREADFVTPEAKAPATPQPPATAPAASAPFQPAVEAGYAPPGDAFAAPPAQVPLPQRLVADAAAGRLGSRLQKPAIIAAGAVVAITLIVLLAIFLFGSSRSPEAVVRAMFDSIETQNVDAILKDYDPEVAKADPELEKQLTSDFVSRQFGLNFTSILTFKSQINGNQATVKVTAPSRYVRGGDQQTYSEPDVEVLRVELISIGGRWCIEDYQFGHY